jgi:hypothetical protein
VASIDCGERRTDADWDLRTDFENCENQRHLPSTMLTQSHPEEK